jgi:hypothetical protein
VPEAHVTRHTERALCGLLLRVDNLNVLPAAAIAARLPAMLHAVVPSVVLAGAASAAAISRRVQSAAMEEASAAALHTVATQAR